jgi:hypothetical protein
MNLPLLAAGGMIAAAGVVHSVLGERRIMPRIRAMEALDPRMRRVLTFTWHLAGLLMLLSGITVAWPGTPAGLVRLVGVVYLLLGLLSLKMSRGRHISGPLFTGGGLLALVGA